MGKITKGASKINFTMLYGKYYYIIIENFPQKFSPCTLTVKLTSESRIKMFDALYGRHGHVVVGRPKYI